MNGINIPNVTVNIIPPVTEFSPVDGRQYMVERLLDQNQLMLTIHQNSNHKRYTFTKEIPFLLIAEWVYQLGQYAIIGKVMNSENQSSINENVEKALMIMVNGDRKFFKYFPWLLEAPIYIQFYNEDNQMVTNYYGSPRRWILKERKEIVR